MTKKPKILLVDDEPSLLAALKRTHRKTYRLTTASSGAKGLRAIEEEGPFDVVVSDFQMPEMNGAVFLSKVADVAPDCIRLMLTGNADLQTAIDAVNTGRVFRFMTKPCDAETFRGGVDAALEQAHFRRMEKDLLEGTLKGSIEVLSEILSLSHPDAFGRANRVRSYVSQLAEMLDLPDRWMLESAAMLSQIGCVALPGDLLTQVARGEELTQQQREAYDRHPAIAAKLLRQIPRLDGVAQIIQYQATRHDEIAKQDGIAKSVSRGAQVLNAALALDELIMLGANMTKAISTLGQDEGAHSQQLLRYLARVKPPGDDAVARTVLVGELRPGMILGQDVHSKSGALIVAKGHTISDSLVERLTNYHQLRGVREPIHVMVDNQSEDEAA